MSRTSSLPTHIPILPLFDHAVLFPSLLLRIRVTTRTSVQLLSHILRSDQATLINLVLGCVPLRPGTGIAEIIGEDNSRPALPAPESKQSENPEESKEQPSGPEFGCSARIKSLSRIDRSHGTTGFILVVEGICRFRIDKITQKHPYMEALVTHFPEESLPIAASPLLSQLKNVATDLARQLSPAIVPMQRSSPILQLEGYITRADRTDAGQLADMCLVAFEGQWEDMLTVLALTDVKARVEKVLEILTRQLGVLQVSKKVNQKVSNNLTKQQREFYLRQQLNAIKEELGNKDGDGGGEEDDITGLQRRLESAKPPEDVMNIAKRELQRLRRVPQASAEHNVIRTYVEVLADIPWSKSTIDDLDIGRARKQFDDDHYGLEKVKKRLLEYLAILKLKRSLNDDKQIIPAEQDQLATSQQTDKPNPENPESPVKEVAKSERRDRAPILLLVGPPGTGKTSLAKSIASALGRKFHRISLGGVRDEAEIRGHRRTYVASFPGLIVQGLRKAGINNPVFLLDEIDKIGMNNYHGDPSAAMLEVLDPEQNHAFNDHYVGSPVDLSKVLFIATANSQYTIHDALLDRMEMIELPGYTFDEKLHIAKEHLIPKQLDSNALGMNQVKMDDRTILKIITGYTREAGVRGLEKRLGAVCRGKAVQYAEKKEQHKESEYDPNVTIDDLETILGTERYENEVAQANAKPGIVTGLVVAGGSTGEIMFIECTEMPGSGNLQLTGQLGEVMKESASIAMSWVKSNAFALGLTNSATSTLVKDRDIHIHFPVGAIPKDGPSAGIGLAVGLVSLLSHRAVDPKIAMTGEISLRGQVLPIGGLKHKVLAAHRAGIETVLLPKRNEKDLKEIPADVKEGLRFILVSTMWDVLREIWPNYLKEDMGVGPRL